MHANVSLTVTLGKRSGTASFSVFGSDADEEEVVIDGGTCEAEVEHADEDDERPVIGFSRAALAKPSCAG